MKRKGDLKYLITLLAFAKVAEAISSRQKIKV